MARKLFPKFCENRLRIVKVSLFATTMRGSGLCRFFVRVWHAPYLGLALLMCAAGNWSEVVFSGLAVCRGRCVPNFMQIGGYL